MASSKFANDVCLDVHGEVFGFLPAKEQAKLRRTSKYFCTVFNHAFQRGYIAAAIHQGYVEKLDAMHEDGEDGHPLLRVAPGDPNALVWGQPKQRSEKDNDATLFVNVRLVLGSGKVMLENFLSRAPFKAVHLYGTETVVKIEDGFLCQANVQTFTMTTPCPKLREVRDNWLQGCRNLTHFDISGCCALESVGNGWLYPYRYGGGGNWLNYGTALKSASFKGCHQLKRVGYNWMNGCHHLSSVDLGDLVALEEVAGNWLKNSCSLVSVDFSRCRALRVVGNECLAYCDVLKTIDLRGCVALEDVGCEFLKGADCRSTSPSVERILVSKDQKLPASVAQKVAEELVVVVD